jgi:GTP-binding protein
MTKQRILKIVEAAERAVLANRKKVSTSLLNQVITEAQALSPPPPAQRGRRLKIYYSTQVAISPPTFLMFVNEPKLVNQSYETYLKRKIREAFGFNGSPLRIKYRPKERNK